MNLLNWIIAHLTINFTKDIYGLSFDCFKGQFAAYKINRRACGLPGITGLTVTTGLN